MKNAKIFLSRSVLVFSLLLLIAGCGETKYLLKYEVPAEKAQVWPKLPDKPRFRYVGELTGEQNLKEVEGSRSIGTRIVDFLKWVVGLGSFGRKPVVLQRPQSGVVDNQGRILVTDVSRHAVFVFDPVGGSLKLWERATGDYNFVTPVGITLGKENTILVADAELGAVFQLDDKGNPVRSFGENDLKRPTGIARDPVSGQIFVADTKGHDIKIFNDDGSMVGTIGKRGVNPGEFNGPTYLNFSKNKLYVTDTLNARVQILTRTGDFLSEFGRRGNYVGDMVRPKGVAAASDGTIYVIESLNDYLLVYSAEGQFLMPLGGTGSGVGQFYLPSGVWTDSKDRVYIADMFNGRIVILQYLGNQ